MTDLATSTALSTPGVGAMRHIYGYALGRADGSITRLIPADQLPPLRGIPAREVCSVGLLVLPPPAGLAPTGRMFYEDGNCIVLQQVRLYRARICNRPCKPN
jgi:hypothetical protein